MQIWEDRPWGKFKTIYEDLDAGIKIKILIVNPNSRLSLQSHQYRSEQWFVLRGDGLVIIKERKLKTQHLLYPKSKFFIEKNMKHRLINSTDSILEILEIQIGEKVEESDIERFEDDYGRIKL